MAKWDLHKIEKAFTAAAVEPNLWSSALDCVSAQTESRGALILPIQGNPLPHTPISEGVARATEAYFRDGWHSRDERNRGAPTLIRSGVADDFDIMPFDIIRRHPYYQEFLAPAGLRWFAGVKMGAGDDFWCLSIQRGLNELPFSPEEKRQLAQLSASFQRSRRLHRHLASRPLQPCWKPSTSVRPPRSCSIDEPKSFAPTDQPIVY